MSKIFLHTDTTCVVSCTNSDILMRNSVLFLNITLIELFSVVTDIENTCDWPSFILNISVMLVICNYIMTVCQFQYFHTYGHKMNNYKKRIIQTYMHAPRGNH